MRNIMIYMVFFKLLLSFIERGLCVFCHRHCCKQPLIANIYLGGCPLSVDEERLLRLRRVKGLILGISLKQYQKPDLALSVTGIPVTFLSGYYITSAL